MICSSRDNKDLFYTRVCFVLFCFVTQPVSSQQAPEANPPGNQFRLTGLYEPDISPSGPVCFPFFTRLGQDPLLDLPCVDLSSSGAPAFEWVLGSDSYRCDCEC